MWLALLVLFADACATPEAIPAPGANRTGGPGALCLPSFPYRAGWLGGDAAFSLPLPGEGSDDSAARTTLWLFGDSFVGRAEQPDRRGAAFIHNTIGLSHCTREGWQIEYHWRHGADGGVVAFFDSGTPEPYWWPLAGFTHAGSLYVNLLEVSTSSDPDPSQLPFRLSGARIARIDNPNAPPRDWRIRTRVLSWSQKAFPGSASVVLGDSVYFFSFLQRPGSRLPTFLTRLSLRDLEEFREDLASSLETWTGEGHWRHGFLPDDAHVLMPESASEMSVHYDAELGRWLAVYGFPISKSAAESGAKGAEPAAPRADAHVYLRSAERLEGPWSEPYSIFLIPDLQTDYIGGHAPGTFCYAAKAHPEFSPSGRLLLTYVCNRWPRVGESPWKAIESLSTEMNLYRPQPVLIPLPASLR